MGYKFSEESKRKMRETKLKNPVRYWLGKTLPEEVRKKLSISHKGIHNSPHTEFKKGQKQMNTGRTCFKKGHKINNGRKQSKEHIERRMRKVFESMKRRPTKVEQFFIDYFNQKNLPYKYVGNGKFWIEGKCPDFVNINGEKEVIEVGSKDEKRWRYGNVQKYISNRTNHFRKYGWRVNFYWIEDYIQIPKTTI
jgi:hypothetical protein